MLENCERPVLTSLVDEYSVGMVGGCLRCTKDYIHSSNFDLREIQHYSVSMCEKVLSFLK